ncbi:MAG: hypothetical protein N3A58_08995 [Spirochaetes bacterium]|nr:hypothetical protein [Spirochaetota bacterium]
MKFIKIPYRYLFINKKRTFISALSIFVSCIIVAIGYGWIDGMINNMINSYKNIQTGNIRVVNKDFIKFEKFKPIEYLIEDTTNIKEKINKFLDKFFSNYPKKIRKFEIIERLKFNAFAGYKNNSSIAQIFALEFNKEKERFKFEKNLIYGSSTINSSEILIAEGLAKKLNVYQNDSIIISAQTFSGGLNARKFKIKGIVKITLSNLNKSAIFMNLEDAKTLIKLPENTGTEILIFFDNAFTEILTKELKKYISDNKNEFPFNFLENYALHH